MITNITKIIRAATRILGLCLLTAVAAPLYLVARLFGKQNRAKKIWARNVAKVLNLKITVKGEPPDAPFFLVSNHLSYVDIVSLMAILDCVFVSKNDVANWFAIGRLARMVGTIFIDRENNRSILAALKEIDSALKNKMSVVVFPEGTSTKGETILPFKTSLLEIAASENLNVHYASLSYKVPDDCTPASLSICWWGDTTFGNHAWRLCQLRESEIIVTFSAKTISDENRKRLAKKLWSAVNEQFIPTA
jgi:1-acyl-sn-glycerol-3-phosphate acyltransferase